MTIRHLDQIVAALLALFGVYLVWSGLAAYSFMQGPNTPGPGYFPVIMGGALVVLSLVNLGRSLAGLERIKATMSRGDVARFVLVVVAMAVFVAITPLLGMTVATGLLVAALAMIIKPSLEPGHLVRVGLTAVIVPVVCTLLFGILLRVPIPTGFAGF